MIEIHNGIQYHASIEFHMEDPDLQPIIVDLPKPPAKNKIDNHDLPAKLQIFHYQVLPDKLRKLQQGKNHNNIPYTLEEMHQIIKQNPAYYYDEIKWIKKQWHRRLYGYWVFINGVATYIDGWHYFYLNFWPVDNKHRRDRLPDYRNRDFKWFHAVRYMYRQENCFGPLYPKHRREGATYKCQCIVYCICTENQNAFGATQSMDDDHAARAFLNKCIKPWMELPFFFKPLYDGSTEPKTRLRLIPQSQKARGGSAGYNEKAGLGGEMRYYPSGVGALDGDKYMAIHHDEVGKKDKNNVDYYERWLVAKQTLAQGNGSIIHGLGLLTSTVADSTTGGGDDFARIAASSYHHEIDEKTKQTASGLWNLFIPATEGLDGFVDEYGNSIVDDPVEPVRNELGKMITIGSRTFLQNKLDQMRQKEDWKALNETTRQFPQRFRDCFRKSSESSGFNLQKLNDFMDIYRRNKKTRVGNFRWVDDIRFGKVEWVDDPENGKWVVSNLLRPEDRNRVYWDKHENSYMFVNPGLKFTGGDTVKFPSGKVKGGRKSKGAFAVFYAHDDVVDSLNIDKKYWISDQFVCTYKQEVYDLNIYNEDLLMTCWFYGSLLYPELNIYNSVTYFEDNKCRLLMLYDLNDKFQFNANPGTTMTAETKQEIFKLWMTYVEHGLTKEKHGELIEEVMKIDGPADMTNHDLFAAGGLALKAAKSRYIRTQENEQSDTYNGSSVLEYEEI
jgi:hypothetical protein